MPLPVLSDSFDAARRVIVFQRWRDGRLVPNLDFEDASQTPHFIAEAIASDRYAEAEIAEVWEMTKGEPGREITEDCYAVANHLREIAYERAVA